ncbi:MAG: lycopene beta-cyclase CrtY [Alphaproteobacteria bacterium]|nr:lycopene beta-cyclase CrtY [Alphaproteobacteria bacterium]MBV9371880.1 lycopene beta-cyclase CrtY [Alphaproteobacteria bacterium]MBV9900203.1 lycopene beta-cyclase CrtY [Alphaproteobacteria bacterium]
MPRGKNHGLLIAGDGAAVALSALAMARLRPEVPVLLVGEGESIGGGRTLFLFDEQLGDEERALLEPLIGWSWDGCYVAVPGRSRKLKMRCHAIAAEAIDTAVREALKPERHRSGTRIVAVRDDSLLLQGGETLKGDGAIDARSWAHQTTLELGWRHAARRTCRFERPHRVDLPVLLDSTVPQGTGCAFFACLPLDEERLLIEHVRYATAAEADPAEGERAIDAYVALRGWGEGAVEAESRESLPVPLGGDFAAYYRIGGARVAKLGARGGFVFPTTGSPLPDAARTALALTRQRDFAGAALHDLFEQEAAALWKRRDFYRGFDRLLLRGGGCRAIEGLMGLEPPLIARYFGERLGLFERRKVMAAAGG